jgi:hypothetical protein
MEKGKRTDIPGRKDLKPSHISQEVWDKLLRMQYVEVADLVDDLEEALRCSQVFNEALRDRLQVVLKESRQ